MMAVPGLCWKAARSRMLRITGGFGGFRADQRGTVAIQTIIFSILLFGTTGLVLDAGLVYATHTQMQAYADQMALVAANELDGRDDAINRARMAVFGPDGAPFLEKAGLEVGRFRVETVDFFPGISPSARPQNHMFEAFPPAARLARATEEGIAFAHGDPVAAANAATVALVSVSEERLASAVARIASLVLDLGGSAAADAESSALADGLGIAATAAASLERRSCAALSTLVLCNPWEEAADSPLAVPKHDPAWSLRGRSLMTFAPNFRARSLPESPQTTPNTASLYPWDVKNQLFRLADPVADSAGLCTPGYLLALATEDASGEGAPDYLAARDRCLMARAHPETVCWDPNAPLAIAPADGDTVARALNTAFDNWLEPFDQALDADVPVGGTGLARAQFFEPDRLATTAYESADRHGEDPATEPQQDGVPDYDEIFAEEGPPGAYETVPMPESAPLYAVRGRGIGYDPCHDGTTARYAGSPSADPACTLDFVGDYHEGGSAGAGEVRSRLEHYWSTMYDEATADGLARGALPGGVTTWYELYRVEKNRFAGLDTEADNSRIEEYSDLNAARLGLDSTTEDYVKHGPDEYMTATGSDTLLNPGYERRRLRSAMVNCAATVAQAPDASGRYPVDADNLWIMDVYLPTPPGIYCGPGTIGCELEAAVETRLLVELVDDVTERSDHRRYVARLVR
jgi:Flp pilus assembly protein TadG